MRSRFSIAILLSLSVPAIAGKPGPGGGSPPPNAEVGYRSLSGKSVKLMVANANATNAVTLYTSATPFNFDLGPRSTHAIAIVGNDTNARLSLLTYATSGSGVLQTQSVTALTAARRGSHVDFSPDGSKIAFACCSDGTNETLAVYDLQTGTVTPWATAPFFWDLAFFRDGAAIAYSVYGPTALYEVDGPGATPQLLFSPNDKGEIDMDSSRLNPAELLVSYNDAAGAARIGLFDADSKQLIESDLAHSALSFQGHFDCQDRRLAYLGSQNTSGSQAFYIRDLQTGLTSLFSKSSNILLQFFPTCS